MRQNPIGGKPEKEVSQHNLRQLFLACHKLMVVAGYRPLMFFIPYSSLPVMIFASATGGRKPDSLSFLR